MENSREPMMISEYMRMTLKQLYFIKSQLENENAQSFELEIVEDELERRKKQKK